MESSYQKERIVGIFLLELYSDTHTYINKIYMNLRGTGYGSTDLGCPQFLLFSSVATGGESVRPSGSQQEQEEGSRERIQH